MIKANADEDVEQQELSFTVSGNAKWYCCFEIQFGVFLQDQYILSIRSCDHDSGHLSNGAENICLHKNLCVDIYSIFIYNCQNLEAIKLPINR